MTLSEDLARLQDLHQRGALTDDECIFRINVTLSTQGHPAAVDQSCRCH